MASITAPEFPGERLVVCRNPDLAAERARKREELLTVTERDLTRIQTAVGRRRGALRGTAEIALAVGAVINRHKMGKHFDLTITDTSLGFARKHAEIAAEAAIDGIYVVRTSLPAETFDDAATVRSYKSLAVVDIDQAWRLSSIMSWVIGAPHRRRQASPGERRRADRLQMGNRSRIGRYQLR